MHKTYLPALLMTLVFVPAAVFAAATVTPTGPGAKTGSGGPSAAPKPIATLGPPQPPSGVAAANCGPLTNGLSEVRGTAPVVDLDDVYEGTSVFVVPDRPAVQDYIGALRSATKVVEPPNAPPPNPEYNIANAYLSISDELKYAHPARNGAFDCKGVTNDLAVFDVIATTFEKLPVGVDKNKAKRTACYPTSTATPPPCIVVEQFWWQYRLPLVMIPLPPPFTAIQNGKWLYIGSRPAGFPPDPNPTSPSS